MYIPHTGGSCDCEPGSHQDFDTEAAVIADTISDEVANTQRHFSYYWDVSGRGSDPEEWKICMADCILVLRRAGWTVQPPE